jgi:RNA polymerase sigma-70 factor (ECF subfamily)
VREFEEWYRELYPRFVTTLAVSLGSREEAAEVAGDAFVTAFEQWDRVGRMDNPSGWAFRVAMNRARRRGRRRTAERNSAELLAPSVPVGGEGLMELQVLLSPLPERMRQVVALRHVADLTEPAIAEVLGISRGTVSSTLRDAYPRLAELMKPEEQQR